MDISCCRDIDRLVLRQGLTTPAEMIVMIEFRIGVAQIQFQRRHQRRRRPLSQCHPRNLSVSRDSRPFQFRTGGFEQFKASWKEWEIIPFQKMFGRRRLLDKWTVPKQPPSCLVVVVFSFFLSKAFIIIHPMWAETETITSEKVFIMDQDNTTRLYSEMSFLSIWNHRGWMCQINGTQQKANWERRWKTATTQQCSKNHNKRCN